MAYARVTYAHLVDSSADMLKQVFSDYTISDLHLLFWVQSAVNTLKQRILEGGKITGSYLQIFTQVPITLKNVEGNNYLTKQKYLILPANIFDLTNDRAIDWMCYYPPQVKPLQSLKPKPIFFERSTFRYVNELRENSTFGKPSASQPYFARKNELLYLYGIEEVAITTVDMGLYTSIKSSVLEVDLDDEVLLNDEEVAAVLRYVMQLGRFSLSIPQDRAQNAADDRDAIPLKPTQTETQP